MKKLSRYLSKLRSKTGTIVAMMVFLLFTQQINYHQEQIRTPVVASSSQENEDDDADSGKSTMITVDQDIIASVIQFNVNHVFYVIMNIEQDEEEDTFENAGINSLPDEFHKVLFCQVISPNAP